MHVVRQGICTSLLSSRSTCSLTFSINGALTSLLLNLLIICFWIGFSLLKNDRPISPNLSPPWYRPSFMFFTCLITPLLSLQILPLPLALQLSFSHLSFLVRLHTFVSFPSSVTHSYTGTVPLTLCQTVCHAQLSSDFQPVWLWLPDPLRPLRFEDSLTTPLCFCFLDLI